jgi:rhamnosyltransferase
MSVPALTGAVVVTYQPDERVVERLNRIRPQVDRLVVVDNGSPEMERLNLQAWASGSNSAVIANTSNRGLAAALNQGMAWNREAGAEWVVTFDQDSTPSESLVTALLASAQRAHQPHRVAIVGSNTFDEKGTRVRDRWLTPGFLGFKRVDCSGGDLADVTFVITSGALTSVRAWQELGHFDEGLFIDYIDHDFCLKAHKAGWTVGVSAEARLAHNLGSKRVIEIAGRTMRPTFHNAARHYYMARNRVWMWKRYAFRFPHWWLFDFCFGGLNAIRVLVAENDRGIKLLAMMRGTFHAFLGRKGAMT